MFLADLGVPYSLITQSVSSLCCDRSLGSLVSVFCFVRTYPLFTVTYSSYGDCFSFNLSADFVLLVLFSCISGKTGRTAAKLPSAAFRSGGTLSATR